MSEFYNSLTAINLLFFYSAIFGGSIFIFKGIMMIIGADSDVDFDATSGEFDAAGHWISVQSVSAFLMIFGLAGLTASKQFGLNLSLTVTISIAAGFAMVLLVRILTKAMHKLDNNGAMDLTKAIHCEGQIYQQITPGGRGKVQVVFQGILNYVDAMSDDEQTLETGTIVIITDVINQNILKVKRK
ncbi:MAG: hypothetical protein ACRC37_02165 [Lentisphaeria bacterium]